MNTKKILLPETTFKERTKTKRRKRPETTELHPNSEGTFTAHIPHSKCAPLITDSRQKNEAVGLVMIGLSAFSLSLIHYISSSGIPGIVNGSMVYLGIGVYIVPALVGVMGVQKFLDRPFQNLGWRLAGSLGTIIFSLGLFYTEGGKIGAWTYLAVSSIFGAIPTKILFFALLMSSTIFALDILYKDVLGALLVVGGLATKFLKFSWEVGINLVSMSIGAAKTTTKFFAISYKRIQQAFNEKQIDPQSNLGKLLAFRPHLPSDNNNEKQQNNIEIAEHSETENKQQIQSDEQNQVSMVESKPIAKVTPNNTKQDEEEAQIIPMPKLYNPGSEQEVNEEKAEGNTNNSSIIQSVCLPTECVFVNSSISVIAANVTSEIDSQVNPSLAPEDKKITDSPTSNNLDAAKEIFGYSEGEDVIEVNNDTFSNVEIVENSSNDENTPLIEEQESVQNNESDSETSTKIIICKKQEPKEEIKINNSEKTEEIAQENKFVEKETVYLEDNRIDHEIKQAEKTEAPKKINVYANCKLPPLEILKIPPVKISNADIQSELSYRSAHLLKTLGEFGIKASITDIVQGPAVSRFELKPAPGVKVRQITSLTDDIALSLAAQSIAIEAPIPGKSALGIIIPNSKPTPVYFYNLLNNDEFMRSPNLLQIAVGVTINGTNIYYNLAEMPHLLIAGSTGSGKSVCVNSIIASILFKARPDQVKFIMIDPKMVELSGYNGIPHLIAPVVTDPAKASGALMWAVEEMERRYELLSRCQGVKNISTFNEKIEELREEVDPSFEPMPYIVIVIDELADLMMTCSAEVEGSICRLTQMARAVGMHLIIATQRPSVNVITGLIKANLPSRIAFSVSSQVDSKTILDAAGAEKLLGKGDMLFLPKGLTKPKRLQGPYVSDNELNDLINFVKSQGKPEYLNIAVARNKDGSVDDDEEDEEEDSDLSLIDAIKKYLQNQEKTSTSMLQRKFRIGYNRAARIMDQLEEEGIVSPSDGSKQRRVINGRSTAQV